MNRRHLRLGKEHSRVGLALWIRHPDTGMDNPHVFDFSKRTGSWNRIIDRPFPGKTAENEFQAAELQEPCSGQCAHHISATANTDYQRTRRSADEIFERLRGGVHLER